MSTDAIRPIRKPFVRPTSREAEKQLDSLLCFLEAKGLHFYDLIERNMGEQRYVDVKVSIKLS